MAANQIGWTNVQAPDFNAGIQVLGQAAGSFRGALTDVGEAASAVNQSKTAQILANIKAAVNGAGSVDEAQQMLRSGNIAGYNLADPGIAQRVDPATIQAMIDGRIKGQEGVTAYDQKTKLDSLAPDLFKQEALLSSGLAPGIAQGWDARNGMDVAGLSYSQIQALRDRGQALQSSGISGYDSAAAAYENRADLAAKKIAEGEIQKITQAIAPGDVGGAERAIIDGHYDPKVEALLRAHFAVGGGAAGGVGGAAGVPGAAGGGGPLAPDTGVPSGGADLNAVVGNVLKPPKPLDQMTVGEWQNFGSQVRDATKSMDPDKRAALGLTGDQGSSALGRFQILSAPAAGGKDNTLQRAAKALGWTPNTVMDEAHQMAAGKFVYDEAAKNGNMAAVFPSVTKSFAPGTDFSKIPFEQAYAKLAQGESGGVPNPGAAVSSNPTDAQDGGVLAANALATRYTKDDPRGVIASVARIRANPANADVLVPQVADQLIAPGGAFAGTSKDVMVRRINKVIADADGGITAMEAATLLSKNIAAGDHFKIPIPDLRFGTGKAFPIVNLDIGRIGGGTNLGTGGAIKINEDGLANDIALVKNNGQKGVQDAMLTQYQMGRARQQQAQAQALVDQSAATLKAMRIRQATVQPTLNLAPYEAAAAAAQAQLNAFSQKVATDPKLGGTAPAAPAAPGPAPAYTPAQLATFARLGMKMPGQPVPVAKTTPGAKPAARPAAPPVNKAPQLLAGYGD